MPIGIAQNTDECNFQELARYKKINKLDSRRAIINVDESVFFPLFFSKNASIFLDININTPTALFNARISNAVNKLCHKI